jgi:hypothetical protein
LTPTTDYAVRLLCDPKLRNHGAVGEDERFQVPADRWHARFVLEAELPLREAEGVMTVLCRLRGADRHVVRSRLLLVVERVGPMTQEIRSHA